MRAAAQRRRTLVERRRVCPVRPRVRKYDRLRAVLHDAGEVAALEEGLVEIKLQHVMQARVDVDPPGAKKKKKKGGVSKTAGATVATAHSTYMKLSSHSNAYVWKSWSQLPRRRNHQPNVFDTALSHGTGPQFSEPRT